MTGATAEQLDPLQALADLGIVTSLAYGPCGHPERVVWSVTCVNRFGQDFHTPYAANSLIHAVEVAVTECRRRGWLRSED